MKLSSAYSTENISMEKHLLLPKKNEDSAEVIAYLLGQGIDKEIIQFCMDSGRIYHRKQSMQNAGETML